MTRHPQTSRRQAAALLLSSLALSVAGLELGCRLIGIDRPRLYRTDADRGWSLKANVRTHWTQEGSASVHTNSQGYRDREWSLLKESGTLRIAVLGDSFTEALQVPLEQTWVSQLPKAMAAIPSCRLLRGFQAGAETLNFGIGGYGTGQSWLTWQKDVRPFKPQLVLHAVYFENDLRDNTNSQRGSGAAPTFMIEGEEIRVNKSFRESRGYLFRTSLFGKATDWVLGWSRLSQLLNQLKNYGNHQTDTNCGKSSCSFFPLGPDGTKLYGMNPEDLTLSWKVMEGIIRQWNEEVKETSSKLVITSLTTPPQMWPNLRERQQKADDQMLDWFKPEKKLAKLLSSENITYIPLAKDMQDQANRIGLIAHGFSGQKPGPGYGHWNKHGHKSAANILARKLCLINLYE